MVVNCACYIDDRYPITMTQKRGRGFGFGGFSLSGSFHKAGQRSTFEDHERQTWGGSKKKTEEEWVSRGRGFYDIVTP